ncbi:MAG: YqcC family protein [Comamonas sp.]|nr:YqcC family protein [Comamonas sp.]
MPHKPYSSPPPSEHPAQASEPHQPLRSLLLQLEEALRQAQLWDAYPPSAQALASTMPFMVDTLRIEQWLQWVLIARLHALLDAQAPLPSSCSAQPLAAYEWKQRQPPPPAPAQKALRCLAQIDTYLSQQG